MKTFYFEPIVLIIRGGEDTRCFGDQYQFSATIMIHDGVATIKGASGSMPICPRLVKEFVRELKSKYGVTSVVWERIKNGEVKHVVASEA